MKTTEEKVKKYKQELKLSCMQKLSLLFIINLIWIDNRAFASNTNAISQEILSPPLLEKKVRILGNLNNYDNTKMLTATHSKRKDENSETKELGHVTIALNNYMGKENYISNFDQSITYKSIKIEGNSSGLNSKKKRKQKELCMRFIEAFGDVKTEKLILQNINALETDKTKNCISNRAKSSLRNMNHLKTIVFTNVCDELIIDLLTQYKFKELLEVVIKDEKSRNWDFLLRIAKVNRYKKIEMHSISSLELTPQQVDKLKTILGVLLLTKQGATRQLNTYFKTEDRPVEEEEDACKKITISEFEVHEKIHSGKLKLFADSINDFDPKHLLEEEALSSIMNTEEHDQLVERQNEEIINEAKCINSHFVYCDKSVVLELNIKFKKPTAITPFLLKAILLWVAVHKDDATSLTISNLTISERAIKIFREMKVQINSMPHLKRISLEKINSDCCTKIVLRNINHASECIQDRTELKFKKESTILFPLNMCVQKEIFQRANEEEVNVHSIKHSVETEKEGVLNICAKTCKISIFTKEADKADGCKSTSEVFSLQEVEHMTWSQFCKSNNQQNITAHLRKLYKQEKNPKFKLTEKNFRKVIEYVIDKPLFCFNNCHHIICMDCLNILAKEKPYELSRIDSYFYYKNIKCPVCEKNRKVYRNLFSFIRIGNIENIQEKFIYLLQSQDINSQKYQYISYKDIPSPDSMFSDRYSIDSVRPNFVITQAEIIREKNLTTSELITSYIIGLQTLSLAYNTLNNTS